MHCPDCREPTRVEETRKSEDGRVRRYRRCERCRHRFATIEQLDLGSHRVLKRDGSTEAFSRAKLLKSIRKAFVREVPTSELGELIDRVIETLFLDEGRDGRTPQDGAEPGPVLLGSTKIGDTIMDVLGADRQFRVLQVRYALLFESEDQSFNDAESLVRWLKARSFSGPRVEEEPTHVRKRDGSVETFDDDKLKGSIRYAAKKKPNSEAEEKASDQLGDLVHAAVLKQIRFQPIVTSGQLAAEVMRALHPSLGPKIPATVLSPGARELAYLRFASTAKSFGRAEDFADEAKGLGLSAS